MSPLFKMGRGKQKLAERPGTPAGDLNSVSLVETKLGLLRESDLFHGLSEDQMRRIDQMTTMIRCERGRIIYTPGQTGEALFLLKRGKVHIYRLSPEGKRIVTAVVGPGTLFGDMTFTGHAMRDSFAEAVEESAVCVMSRHDVEDLIFQYPSVAIRLVDALARRVRELEARLEESSLRDMQARVAAALLRLCNGQDTTWVTVTHQELADTIGTYRETVTRTLGDLRDRGYITLERHRIGIANFAGLQELVASHTDLS